ncbi:RICIN domain-containing protein [Nocardia salmonicida]|uniref:RICIN domain-containing protein n=1 Tax=Nocardia salmonicida TaxID=53431 RepID=UPI003413D352
MRALVMISAAIAVLATAGPAFSAPVNAPVTFKGDASGKCLDVFWGSADSGRPIVQWDCEGQASQKFSLSPIGTGGTLALKTFAGKCWDLEGGSTADNTAVIQWPCNGNANQTFVMSQKGSPSYWFTHPASKKCLGIAPAGATNNAQLVLLGCTAPGVQGFALTSAP